MTRREMLQALAGLGLGAALPSRADLPATFEELRDRHAADGKAQEPALKLWFDSCFVYMDRDTRDAGRRMIQYLTIPLRPFDDWDRETANAVFVERLQKPEYQHIFRSYAIDATPENGYRMDPERYELRISDSRRDPYRRGWEVALKSSGAETPRPVYLRQQTESGLWFVSAYGNVYMTIAPPKGQ